MNTSRMHHVLWAPVVLMIALPAVWPTAIAEAQEGEHHRIPGRASGWCQYPLGRPRPARLPMEARFWMSVDEVEPNDTPGTAQPLPLGDGPGEDRDIDVVGSISVDTDADYYHVILAEGDVIGIAVLGEDGLNAELAITLASGGVILVNDNHQDIADLYPVTSPLPGGVGYADSVLSWVVPAAGEYLLLVTSHSFSSDGPYTLEIRSRRPGLEQVSPAQQIIFLDFDGETIDAQALFGRGYSEAVLSPLSTFLGNWGLAGSAENAVIDAILAEVQENLEDLEDVTAQYDFDLRNSRDHADPFGQPYVSRVIVGGTIAELGIATLGISESIDPGNLGTEETAVVLLDTLSAESGTDSINPIPRASGVSIIEVIGRTVGNITTHEMAHYLGNWHTENNNEIECLIDKGGNGVSDEAGVGPDGVFGTDDDVDVDFVADLYEYSEQIADGIEWTATRTAYGLAVAPVPPPTVYVDAAHTGYEDGTEEYPFDTVTEGVDSLPADTRSLMLIVGGNYPEALTISKPIRLQRNGGGAVLIGE
jgi:hypothetical protein